MKAKTFIFCHNADIALQCEREKRFSHLPSYTWVMLGFNNFDSIKHLNPIIAREEAVNIERHPNIVAWTGWYVLAKNGYIQNGDVVNLFEYDIVKTGDFTQMQYCGYFTYPVNKVPFWSYGDRNFEPLIKELTGKGSQEFFHHSVPSTSNYTLTWDNSYLDLITDCIGKKLVKVSFIGHVLERAYSQKFFDAPCQLNSFKHLYNCSHKF
jgi:hypothetical protein